MWSTPSSPLGFKPQTARQRSCIYTGATPTEALIPLQNLNRPSDVGIGSRSRVFSRELSGASQQQDTYFMWRYGGTPCTLSCPPSPTVAAPCLRIKAPSVWRVCANYLEHTNYHKLKEKPQRKVVVARTCWLLAARVWEWRDWLYRYRCGTEPNQDSRVCWWWSSTIQGGSSILAPKNGDGVFRILDPSWKGVGLWEMGVPLRVVVGKIMGFTRRRVSLRNADCVVCRMCQLYRGVYSQSVGDWIVS